MEDELQKIYYDLGNEASFSGVGALYRVLKEKGFKKVTHKRIEDWLQKQETHSLHKPVRHTFPRNRVIVSGKDDQFQADLIDLTPLSRFNKGYKYWLTCIDVLSKYGWAIPLKTKTGREITDAFAKILKSGRKPKKLQTDKGTEFLNRIFQNYLKKQGIHFFTTHSETKCGVVKRFNRTLKTKLYKYFTYKNTHQYLNILPDLLKSYNQSFHRSIRMKPIEVTKKNENAVWHTLYGKPISTPLRFQFQVGDQVRISKAKKTFDKGYKANWSIEIFTVADQLPRIPPVYRLKDQQGEMIEGVFYEPEIQKVEKEDDVYQIEKVLKRRKLKGGVAEVFVKWRGYPDKFNSWIPANQVQKL